MQRRIHPPPHTHVHRLVRWQRHWLYSTGTLLTLTGAAWLTIHYSIGAGAGQLPHPAEVWSMRLHGLAAFAGLFALGALAAAHIPQGWRLSKHSRWAGQRTTGCALCALGVMLVLSGYLLYYFAPEEVRPVLGWAHAVLGIAMGLAVLFHRRGV
ncbi:MAG: DUF4405 domain-containing protein [Burkholderiaceae bacterium]|nr:DUF4405 domain-containing protein [Burkholderiaceae bacterium]